jgi:hypothetical protein
MPFKEGDEVSEKAGLINEYVCQKCGGITRTINRDEGTTPFMTGCRAVIGAGCKGLAQSSFYRVSQNRLPHWEWIRPTPEEFERWLKDHKQEEHREAIAEHVAQGGMVLRKCNAADLGSYGFRLRLA